MICCRVNFKLSLIITDTLYASCPKNCGLCREGEGRGIIYAVSSYIIVKTIQGICNLYTWAKSIKPEQLTGCFQCGPCSKEVAVCSKGVDLTCGRQHLTLTATSTATVYIRAVRLLYKDDY
jgi:hypothetical protein